LRRGGRGFSENSRRLQKPAGCLWREGGRNAILLAGEGEPEIIVLERDLRGISRLTQNRKVPDEVEGGKVGQKVRKTPYKKLAGRGERAELRGKVGEEGKFGSRISHAPNGLVGGARREREKSGATGREKSRKGESDLLRLYLNCRERRK